MKFKEGDSVFINISCQKTKREYGMNNEMLRMMGKKFKIRKIRDSKSVFIRSHAWHISDLRQASGIDPLIKKEEQLPKLFDINDLII